MNPDEAVAQLTEERKIAPLMAHFADKNAATIGRFTHLIIDLRTARSMVGPGDRLLLAQMESLLMETGEYPFTPEAIGGYAKRETAKRASILLKRFGMAPVGEQVS